MSEARTRLMAHLVSGYPDASLCRAAAAGLVEGGADYLEIQIPFGDPSADGPAIRDACAVALAKGHRTADAFALAKELHGNYPEVPIFIMAYASLVVTPGPQVFADAAADAGVAGLIIPDLPFDCDEGLAAACRSVGIASVPVAAPSMRESRLDALVDLERPYVYAALRAGITGADTTIDEGTRRFLATVGRRGTAVLGGFGVRTRDQVLALGPSVHAVVAGTVFVNSIREANDARISAAAKVDSAEDRAAAIRAATRRTAAGLLGA